MLLALVVVGASACASTPRRRTSVPIDSRPTPVQPEEMAADSAGSPAIPMSDRTRNTTMDRIVADTTAVRSALNECLGVQLLPDQEGIVDSANSLLARVRASIASGDLSAAESRARQAKQLISSLSCR